MTPQLTVSYGLRYENYRPQTAAKPGGAGSFDPNTGEVLVAGVGSVPLNMGVKPYNRGFAPRLGVAYQVQHSTAIRAGYGRSFTPSGLGAVFGQAPDYDPPITNGQAIPQPNPYTPDVNLLVGPSLPASPPVGTNGRYLLPVGIGVVYFFSPSDSFRIPYADFWNLAVQHQLSSTISAEVAYVGNVGRHLYVNPNLNQAKPGPGDFNPRRAFFPKFGFTQSINDICNCDNSSYHSLQAKLQKRMARGLDVLATYTFAKSMDNTEYGGVYSNNLNFRADHGPSNFDRTHELSVSHIWELPFGRGRKWGASATTAVDSILGGWVFSGITTFYSGLPFSTLVSNTASVNADVNSVRADQIGNPNVANPNANLWFNPASFTVPQQPFRNGNTSRNSLRGPGEYLFNLSLGKNFELAEGKSLEFKWENFNATNHVNLGLPANFVDASGAGQITATQTDMRQMQFGFHFRF